MACLERQATQERCSSWCDTGWAFSFCRRAVLRRFLQRTAVPPPEFFGQCSRRSCRAIVAPQAAVSVLRESYTEEARF
eukprot:5743040-Pleurochrysis_carterae.AAC.1